MAFDADAYLERLSYDGPRAPTLELLRALHVHHLSTVPFENLDIHLERPLSLESDRLFDKVINRRRGGFCYELNGLFIELLRKLGFDAELFAARVYSKLKVLGPERDHALIGVKLDGELWLVDVGFGDAFAEPIAVGAPAATQRGKHHLAQVDDCDDMNIVYATSADGLVYSDEYVVTPTPLTLGDFDEMCRFHQTSPNSPFPRKLVCTRLTDGGRTTWSGRSLIRTTSGRRTASTLKSADELRVTAQREFAIELTASNSQTLFATAASLPSE